MGESAMKCFRWLLWMVLSFTSFSPADEVYDSRIGEREILTPVAPKAPRINGAAIYGARPSKKFVLRIPTQGERPIRFEVTGLPEGLVLDAEHGILSGVTPEKPGDYPMTFLATNGHGKDERKFKLVIGNKTALTPPTGWNSWGGHMLMVSDKVMRKAADLMVEKGLADVGFQYVSIDDCWMRISPENFAARNEKKTKQHEGFDFEGMIGPERDQDGNILPNANFPDMKGMVDYIHGHGLKVGLYSSPGPTTCQGFAGSYGHEIEDARQYARWGFDLLKYDQCSAYKRLGHLQKEPGFRFADFWRPMVLALQLQDRDILFNLCEYGDSNPWTWAPGIGIETWRTGGDLNHQVTGYFDEAVRLATDLRAFSKPGQWNDPDFLYIQKIRDHRKMMAPAVEVPLDTNQRYQYATLWSMICAPYFFSCDIHEIDEFTIRLLANADVVGINQDELGQVATIVKRTEKEVVMVKPLSDGSKAVALFNHDAQNEAEMVIDPVWWGEPVAVLDAWRQRKLDPLKSGQRVKLSPNGVAMFIITPGK